MNDIVKIIAEKRVGSGTGNSRALRSENKIPAIIYGEKKDPILISIDNKKLKLEIQNKSFFSRQCEIKLEDDIYKVLPKDLQLHPVKENIIHIDFLRVGENTTVTLSVPVKFINENKCNALKQGGVLNIVRHEIELKAPVSKIPEFLEADLEGLEIGDGIHISSIKLDQEVKTIITDRDFTVATLAPPTVMKVEEEEEEPTEETDEVEGEEQTEEKTESDDTKEQKEQAKGENKYNEKKVIHSYSIDDFNCWPW